MAKVKRVPAWSKYLVRRIQFIAWCRKASPDQLVQAMESAISDKDRYRRKVIWEEWSSRQKEQSVAGRY